MTARDLAVVQPPARASRFKQYRFTLRRNTKKRWPELQWRHSDNRVTLRMPLGTPLPECLAAFERRVPWFDVFANRTHRAPIAHSINIDGKPRKLVHSPSLGSALRLEESVLWVRNQQPRRLEADLLKFISARTLSAMTHYTSEKASLIEMTPGHIRLSSAMRKWGACDHQNNLNFSWRLSIAPAFVQEYLAAHEVAHFLHKHHRDSFWQEVQRLMPQWTEAEHWLAFCGSTLMSLKLSAIAPAPPGLMAVPAEPEQWEEFSPQ